MGERVCGLQEVRARARARARAKATILYRE